MSNSDPVFSSIAERPFVLVFANEKGGTGKSTLAFHTIVSLLQCGYSVGCIDADVRQRTLSRYIENRASTASRENDRLLLPRHVPLFEREDEAVVDGLSEPAMVTRAKDVLAGLSDCDFVVIDTPGSANALARFAVANADTLISPINDSYIDIDVIANLDMEKREVVGPSQFTRIVWEASNRRVADGLPPTDWIVLRNRLTHINSRNKTDIADLMDKLAKRVGFRSAPGFGERTVYRELFHTGLTVLDGGNATGRIPRPSHAAAAAEMAGLLRQIGVSEPGSPLA
ncbi:MAG: chromosome partitioning protein [Paracoccaceae bacterium]|jgi:chromosome partitioning protein